MKKIIILCHLLCILFNSNAAPNRYSLPFEPEKTAIIVIDMWNMHWCMTASQRVSAMVPRMNRALDVSRQLGATVIWNPSDVVTAYAGFPQYERAVGTEHIAAPKTNPELKVKFTGKSGGCLCGPGLQCRMNYGWDAMHPELVIADDDLISSSTDEIYSLLREKGITTIIYMGVHTNICVFGKPGAMSKMLQAGFQCMLARDLNDAFTTYSPLENYTPDDGTTEIDLNLAEAGIPVFNLCETYQRAGLVKDSSPMDYVRFTPWGQTERPYLFENSTTVSLTIPWLTGATVHYTTDGSVPTRRSAVYASPLELSETTTIRAAAFRNGKQVSLPSEAYFVKLSAETPPKPDVYLEDLEYQTNDYLKSVKSCMWYPQRNRSYEGKPLKMRGKTYTHGMGFRAPSAVQYTLKPEYKRFVGLAGVDENMLEQDNARFLAVGSTVVFKIHIDGRLAAESPVMWLSQEPWRFDVEIPSGSRLLTISCMDADTRSILDYGNLTEAGFINK